MRNEGRRLDYLEVMKRLMAAKAWGEQMMFDLRDVEKVQDGVRVVKIPECIAGVKDSYKLRLLRKMIIAVGDDIRDGVSPDDVATSVRGLLDKMDASQSDAMTPSSVFIESAHDMIVNPKKIKGLPSGLSGLDFVLDGFKPPQLIVFGARPGIGKTSLAVNICNHISGIWKEPSAVFSMEMSEEELGMRMICSKAEVNQRRYKTHPTQTDTLKLDQARQHLKNAPIFVDDAPNLTVSRIAARVRSIKNKHGLGIIIVDYLQLCDSEPNSGRTREEKISSISRGLKKVAKSLNVPVICLAQLNREVERENRRPRKSDLRESGAIEQDADVIGLLHQDEEMEQKTGLDSGTQVELIIAKHRNGDTTKVGDIMLEFIARWTKFKDWHTNQGQSQQTMKQLP
jgi:replicative DNA helicase